LLFSIAAIATRLVKAVMISAVKPATSNLFSFSFFKGTKIVSPGKIILPLVLKNP